MSFKTYKQYDSRWGSKNYNGSSTMSMAGCGPTACATVISNHKPKVTPIQTMKYMQEHGYAIRNNGTAWDGIPACMKWGGLLQVKELPTMPDLWTYMQKKHACGVLLFRAGSKGGITWTTAGHFVAFTAMKVKNGKHYLWTRDPGGRDHDGWYCYETQMQGLIVKVWAGISNPPKPTKLERIHAVAKQCSWPKGTPRSKAGYPEGHAKQAYKAALNKAYPHRGGWRHQTRVGASCDVFVGTVVRASGVDKMFPRGCDDILGYMQRDHAKKKWHTVKKYKYRNWKPGTVIFQKYKSGGKHIFIYMGNGLVANAHYVKKTYPIIEKASKIVKKKSSCNVFRVYEPR